MLCAKIVAIGSSLLKLFKIKLVTFLRHDVVFQRKTVPRRRTGGRMLRFILRWMTVHNCVDSVGYGTNHLSPLSLAMPS